MCLAYKTFHCWNKSFKVRTKTFGNWLKVRSLFERAKICNFVLFFTKKLQETTKWGKQENLLKPLQTVGAALCLQETREKKSSAWTSWLNILYEGIVSSWNHNKTKKHRNRRVRCSTNLISRANVAAKIFIFDVYCNSLLTIYHDDNERIQTLFITNLEKKTFNTLI